MPRAQQPPSNLPETWWSAASRTGWQPLQVLESRLQRLLIHRLCKRLPRRYPAGFGD